MEFLKPYPRTLLFVSVLFLLGASSFYLLMKDMSSNKGKHSGVLSGKLVHSVQEVKRKSAQSFVWDRAERGEELYEKDTILVGPESRAEIELKNGDKLEIAENSLIRLESTKNLEASFIRGSGIIRSETGDKIIRVNEEGVTTIEELHARLNLPRALEKIYVEEDSEVEVFFRATLKGEQKEDRSVTVEVSSSNKFIKENTREIAYTKDTSLSLSVGQYFWRLRSEDKAISEVRKFEVVLASAVSLIAPSMNETVRGLDVPEIVSFRWASNETSYDSKVTHELVISENEDFSKITKKEKVKAYRGEVFLPVEKFGSYYWRIESQYSSEIKLFSETRLFHIEPMENIAMDVESPKKDSTFAINTDIPFAWKKVDSKVNYTLQIEDLNRKENKPVMSLETTRVLWNGKKDGVYRWKVSAQFKGKKVGESEWSQFSVFDGTPVQLTSPKAQDRIEFWKVEKAFEFTWEKDSAIEREGRTYVLEVSPERAFENKVIEHRTTETKVASSEISLPQGNLFWRVKLVDEDNHVIKQSETIAFYYGSPSVLEAPAAIFPATDLVWDMAKEGKDLKAEWKEVRDATAYEVMIERQDGTKKIVRTEKPEVELQGVKSGRYQWTVRAIDPLGRKGEVTSPKHLTIARGKLPAPDVSAPKVEE